MISAADAKLCRQLQEMLADYNVQATSSPEEAELKLFEGDFDVLIYDLGAENCFGIEALKVIRKIRPHIPAIVLVGDNHRKVGSQLLDMGLFYLLPKPAPAATLKAVVASALKKSKKWRFT